MLIETCVDLYSSPNTIRVIKSIRMRRAGHVARMGGEENLHTEFWWGSLREGDHLEVPDIGGRIILKWILLNVVKHLPDCTVSLTHTTTIQIFT